MFPVADKESRFGLRRGLARCSHDAYCIGTASHSHLPAGRLSIGPPFPPLFSFTWAIFVKTDSLISRRWIWQQARKQVASHMAKRSTPYEPERIELCLSSLLTVPLEHPVDWLGSRSGVCLGLFIVSAIHSGSATEEDPPRHLSKEVHNARSTPNTAVFHRAIGSSGNTILSHTTHSQCS